MNCKGWIRIVEAVLAVMLIMGVLITTYSKQTTKAENEEIINTINAILDEIVNNNQMRQDILNNTNKSLALFIQARIPAVMDFQVKICKLDEVCGADAYHEEVYAREKIVSSTLERYNAKKLKLFVWEK